MRTAEHVGDAAAVVLDNTADHGVELRLQHGLELIECHQNRAIGPFVQSQGQVEGVEQRSLAGFARAERQRRAADRGVEPYAAPASAYGGEGLSERSCRQRFISSLNLSSHLPRRPGAIKVDKH